MVLTHALGRTPALRPFIGRHQGLFFEPDSGNNPSGGPSPAPAPNPAPADDRQNLQGLLARHNNDAMQVVATLLAENHQLRDERRALRGQIPAQGAVVLSGDDATRWQQYQQLGAIDALQQQLQAAQTATAELNGLRREKLLGDVQQASGYKASVLAQLPGSTDLTYEVRDVTVDGKTAKTAFVKDKDGNEHALVDYAKRTWAEFLPSLTASAPAPAPAGTTFVPQNPGGNPPADLLSQHMQRFQQQRDQAPNPLAPAAPQRGPLG